MNTTVMIRYVCTSDDVFIYNKNNNYNTANNLIIIYLLSQSWELGSLISFYDNTNFETVAELGDKY